MPEIDFVDMTEDMVEDALQVYNFYILNSTATFDDHAISRQEFTAIRLWREHPRSVSKAIYHQGQMIGFCFLLQYRRKDAYRKTAELGIYFKERFTNKGFGKVAIEYLEHAARQRGYRVLIASISGENLPSLTLFEQSGYTRCAHYKGVAEKFGRAQDIIDLQKTIAG